MENIINVQELNKVSKHNITRKEDYLRRYYITQSSISKQKIIVDSDLSVGRQNNLYQHESINRIGSNDSYAVNNSNTESDQTPFNSSSIISHIINQLDTKYNRIKTNISKNHHPKSNNIHGSTQKYDSTIQNNLLSRKNIINNTTKQASRKIRGKEVLVRQKNNRNISYTMKGINDIFKTKKIKQ